jgi:hypothetical protein
MLNWFKTQKKWFIPTGVAAVLVSLLFSITLHVQHKRQQPTTEAPTEKIDTRPAVQPQGQNTGLVKSGQTETASQEQVSDPPAGMIPESKISAFAREPAPVEVIRKLEAMNAYERKTEEKKLLELQVIWPLYFFSLAKRERDTASVMLDASETGFGVIVASEISLKKYPAISTAQPGDKIWLAGKIAGVDTHGTGQITLVTEYVGFTGQQREQ